MNNLDRIAAQVARRAAEQEARDRGEPVVIRVAPPGDSLSRARAETARERSARGRTPTTWELAEAERVLAEAERLLRQAADASPE